MSETGKWNYLWASLIIEELVRNGVDYFCIAPGSRSTPLTVAAAKNSKAKTFVHFDERALAFHALGYASANGGGVAIITTSGTAVANCFPAVIEASKKKLPFVVLTADRPPELRQTGANQTIDQVKIFGEYVRWQTDLPTPTVEIDQQFVLTTIDQAVFRSKGELSGPVHLNCMFREPFLPEDIDQPLPHLWKDAGPYTSHIKSVLNLTAQQKQDIENTIKNISKGVIVVGKLRSVEEEIAVLRFAEQLQWPVFADITSGLRWGNNHQLICTHFDQLLDQEKITVDGVIQLGGRMTSKNYEKWIQEQDLKEYIMVLKHPLRNDPQHAVTLRVQSTIEDFCSCDVRGDSWADDLLGWNQEIKQANEAYFQEQTDLTEAGVIYNLSRSFPLDHALFLSNSLPIREMDRYADGEDMDVSITANRGASGIDGILSSAIGYSQGLDQRVIAVIGDLAFLYDVNALAMLAKAKHPLTIILLNNNGGGIFNFLPIAQNASVFEDFFGTPHDLKASEAAKMFGLNYVAPESISAFEASVAQASASEQSTIIEVRVDRSQNPEQYKNINSFKHIRGSL